MFPKISVSAQCRATQVALKMFEFVRKWVCRDSLLRERVVLRNRHIF